MSGAEFIPDEAVQAAVAAEWAARGHVTEETARRILAAALPHMEPLIRADERRRCEVDLWKRAAETWRKRAEKAETALVNIAVSRTTDEWHQEATDGR